MANNFTWGKNLPQKVQAVDEEPKVDFTKPVQVAVKDANPRDDFMWSNCLVHKDGKTFDLGFDGSDKCGLEVKDYKFRNVPDSSIEEIEAWYRTEIASLDEVRAEKIARMNQMLRHMQFGRE